MRVRALPLVGGVFAAAALATVFVVSQLPREGDVSPPSPAPAPETRRPATATPPAERAPSGGALDAVATAGGEPLAGAEISLYLVLGAGPDGIAFRRAGEGRTGADGHARIAASPGAYAVVARAPGLAPARALVVLPAGEESTRIDLACDPGVALEVRAIAGGHPAAGRASLAPVLETPGLSLGGAPPEEIAVAALTTNRTARFQGLAPGAYRLEVESPGLGPVSLRVAVPSAGPVQVPLDPLGVLSGEVIRAEGRPAGGALVRAVSRDHQGSTSSGPDGRFTLHVPAGEYQVSASAPPAAGALGGVALGAGGGVSGLTLRLGPAAALDGEVVEGGRPRPGAAVVVLAHGTRTPLARAVAGAGGRFRIGGLAPGVHDVIALAPGATPARAEGVTLAPGTRFPLRLELRALGAIEGTVTDAADQPLAGARVRVVSRGDGMDGAVPLEARTDFGGRYRLERIEAGRAELVAVQVGAALGDARAVLVAPSATSRADFFVPAAGVLEGRLARAAGGPLGAAVVAVPIRRGLAGAQVARALPDANGFFRLALPAGEYRVHAAPERSGAEPRAAPAFVRVEPGRTAHLELAAAAPGSEGGPEVLVLEPGGAPSARAEVALSRPDDARIALAAAAGDDGRLPLGRDAGLAGRAVAIRARNGGRSGSFTGPLPASGTITLRLTPGGALAGVVRADGGPVRRFTLEVASQPTREGWRTLDVRRFAGDRFELGDLPAEPLRLLVRTDDGRRGRAELRLGPGEVRTLEIALGGGGPGP